MARKKQEAGRKRFEGTYDLVPCCWCGADVFRPRKKALDPKWVPYVSPPIPNTKVTTIYDINGWDDPATAGDDLPDYVEDDIHFGFLAHDCRTKQDTADAESKYIQEKLPID